MKKKHARSAMAQVAETCFHIVNTREIFETEAKAQAYLAQRRVENEKPAFPPTHLWRAKLRQQDFEGTQVFSFSGAKHPEAIVLYLHGGAYVSRPLFFHWDFCDKLAKQAKATVLLPIYPLAPGHVWKESQDLLFRLYAAILAKTKKPVVFMGDSAGGGLAIAFAQWLKEKGMPQPSRIFAFSPWLDLSMQNPETPAYEAKDPLLAACGLKQMGQAWAGDLPPQDGKVSPLFGEIAGLAPMALFVGTKEIFYPDVVQFAKKLETAGAPYALFIGGGMNHAYPLYPIREGREALETVCRLIR